MPTTIGASKPGNTPKPEKKQFFNDTKARKTKAPKFEKQSEVKAEEPATSEE